MLYKFLKICYNKYKLNLNRRILMYKLIQKLDGMMDFTEVSAHCDMPCGIYDPITAQISALTVVRMVDMLETHRDDKDPKSLQDRNSVARIIAIKEIHAEKVKHEIRIIWGDFLKQPHFEKYPQLNTIVHDIMLLGSENKQHVNRESAVKLVDKVNEFAEIFWAIKGEKTVKAEAPYPPKLELVYRKV